MRLWTVLAVALVAGCGAGAATSVDDGVNRATYRVVLSAPLGGEDLDIYSTRNEPSPDFPRVAENAATGYAGVDKGSYDINLRPAGSSNDVLSEYSTNLGQSRRYLYVTRGAADGSLTLSQHLDNETDAGAGNVLLRFVNATTDGVLIDAAAQVNGSYLPVSSIAADQSSIESSDTTQTVDLDAPNIVTASAGVPIQVLIRATPQPAPGVPIASDPTATQLVTPELTSNAFVTVVVRGTSTQPTLLLVPPVDGVNSTTTSLALSNPRVLLVNGVTDDSAFGAVAPLQQTDLQPSFSTTNRSGTLAATLEGNSTYVVVAVADPASATGLQFLVYQDATADGSIRVINATAGTTTPNITLVGPAITYDDVVYSAASSQLVANPASVTGVIMDDPAGSSAYSPTLSATTRYLILIGQLNGNQGAVALDLDNGVWSGVFVTAK